MHNVSEQQSSAAFLRKPHWLTEPAKKVRRHQHDPPMIPLDTTTADMLFWFAENSKNFRI
jgi:hypothetical protein